MKQFLAAIIIGLTAVAAHAEGDTYFQKVKQLKAFPGYRTQILAQDLDHSLSLLKENKPTELCAVIGSLESRIEIIRQTQAHIPAEKALELASIKAFPITGFCGAKFVGSDVQKEGDTASLKQRLIEIGDNLIAAFAKKS